MIFLIFINLISIFGYATFGMHPELLVKFEWAPPIFAASYSFFAQLQVAVGFGIMAWECQKAFKWGWLKYLLAAAAISFTMEFLGTTFGVPFGKYSYTSLLGWKIAGQVPLLIPLSWFFMSLPSHWIADLLLGGHTSPWKRIFLGSFLLMTWDFTLDPAMSHLTPFWLWESAGSTLLKMPIWNLGGWFFTGVLILSAFELLQLPRSQRWSHSHFPLKFYFANLLLPLGLALVAQLWVSIFATLAVILGCYSLARSTRGLRSLRTPS